MSNLIIALLIIPLGNFIFFYIFYFYISTLLINLNLLFVLNIGSLLLCLGIVLYVFIFLFLKEGKYLVFIDKSVFENVYELKFEWLKVDLIYLDYNLMLDHIGVLMLILIFIVSILVHIYSYSYMKNDPQFFRFMSLLSLFTFFMVLLVLAENLVLFFIGWEGIGLCSYLLVNFWYTRIQANKAGLKAMIVNRIGDCFFILGLGLLDSTFSNVNILFMYRVLTCFNSSVIIVIFGYKIHLFTVICLCFFFAAMCKSAQIFFHLWLPDAMEGPTPVSALIHAATMVTAGIFLLIRLHFLFQFVLPIALVFMLIIGVLTAVFGASVACVQNDIKKIIAYSTCSQLGYMIVACCLYRFDIALYHLINHGFFKALLFLSAGYLIYLYNDEQDIRKMGGLMNIFSFIYILIVIGLYALMGLPFFSGFYSKESIINLSLISYNNIGFFVYLLLLFATFCTGFYSSRLLYLVFFGKPNGFYIYYNNLIKKKKDYRINIVLIILAFLSMLSGWLFKSIFGIGSSFFHFAFFIDLNQNIMNIHFLDIEFISIFYKVIPIIITLFGFISYFIIDKLFFLNRFNVNFYRFLSYKWYFDIFYNWYLVIPIMKISFSLYKNLEKNYLEIVGSLGIYYFFNFISILLNKMNFNLINSMLFLMGVGFGSIYCFCIFILLVGDSNVIFINLFNYLLFIMGYLYLKNK